MRGKIDQCREKRVKPLGQCISACLQLGQRMIQRIGPRQSLSQTGQHFGDNRLIGIGRRQVPHLHEFLETPQPRRQPRLARPQTLAQALREGLQRHIRPVRKLTCQAAIKPHIQHDAGVTSPRRLKQRPCRHHLGMRIRKNIHGSMQRNAAAQTRRQGGINRAMHEVAQHAADLQIGVPGAQQGMRQKVHGPIKAGIMDDMTDSTLASTPDVFPDTASSFTLAGPVGKLEVATDVAAAGKARRATAIICHPHPLQGGTMHNKVVTIVERALRESGLDTVRFNFRGVGASEGTFDNARGEGDDLAAVVAWVRRLHPGDELWLAGFSFGSYVSLANAEKLGAKALISIAPPVGRSYDFDAIDLPRGHWLVVQGEADEVVDPTAVFAWLDAIDAEPVLVRMPDTSHFFHRRLLDLRGAIKNAVRTWLPEEHRA